MKSALIILLVIAVIVLGFSVYSLQKEILTARESAVSYGKRSDDLQRELMRLTKGCNEKEQFLEEIEQSITELDRKIQLETIERYIPKKTWDEIKPIIDRLKAFQESREDSKLSR
jgi:predicted Holliday junction resolvase-like endonuclease